MGQTLTHGVYLPDEGERNCYSGLAANWQILDTSVGTIAAHTAALSGKAPLVHTHTKADITDFPAYGNAAGTICEGNDSRLSDARTPVAHTHVTADVTDLLNTAHEWSKSQTYSDGSAIIIKDYGAEIGNEPSAYNEQRIRFDDKNNNYIAAIKYQNQLSSANHISNGLEFSITNKFKDGVKDATGTAITNVFRVELWNNGTKSVYNEGRWRSNLLPFGNNTNDVGSSSYQWNNLYAKNYFYNGVAWGLDKYNQWTGVNDFNDLIGLNGAELWFKQPNIEDITANPSADTNKSILQIWNKGTTQYSGGIIDGLMADGTHKFTISCLGFPLNNYGGYYPHSFSFEAKRDGTASFSPNYTNASLGTSTNQWKTLNGVNPGALSFPNLNYSDTNQWIDISGNITKLTGGDNWYYPAVDGWVFVITNGNPVSLNVLVLGAANSGKLIVGASGVLETSSGAMWVSSPAPAGSNVRIRANNGSTGRLGAAWFITCQGNV